MGYEDFFDVGFGQTERSPLPPGNYGDSNNTGLRIVSYIPPKHPTTTDPDKYQHGWLTVSTNGIEGQAFANINLKGSFLTPEAISLAFNKGEPVEEATVESVAAFKQELINAAAARIAENNTPDGEAVAATETAVNKMIDEIRINVGTIYRWQDWRGVSRDRYAPLESHVGTEFSGTVKPGRGQSSQVSTVYSKRRQKALRGFRAQTGPPLDGY